MLLIKKPKKQKKTHKKCEPNVKFYIKVIYTKYKKKNFYIIKNII